MKKVFVLLGGFFLLLGTVFSQNYAAMAKKQAKSMTKDGWIVNAGIKPLEVQFEKAYKMDDEVGQDGKKKYIHSSGEAIGSTYSAARLQAIAAAKTEIASSLESEIAGLIESEIDNEELGQEEAESVTSVVSNSKQLISKSLGRVDIVVECYKQLSNKNYKVQVQLFYDLVQAERDAKKAVREELKKKGANLNEKLEKLLGF